jgi:hypothetical protein
MSTPRPTKVTGYLAETWSPDTREALIVNPEARPVDLLAWCWGELESIRAGVSTLHAARGELNRDDFSALVFHRIEPMAAVLGLVIERLLGVGAEARPEVNAGLGPE